MSGTVSCGKKASLTNRQLYGDDFYQRIGRKGGQMDILVVLHPILN